MLGVFDSGMGGRLALRALRRRVPHADIVFLADTAHAPYGTKDTATLISLVTEDIRRLRAAGADAVLCACCTASCILPQLPAPLREQVYPILHPTAAAAARGSCHRYLLLATEATVQSGALARAICACDAQAHIISRPAPHLVTLAEQGRTRMSDPAVRRALQPVLHELNASAADTLVLGCTHFDAFAATLQAALPAQRIISSAKEGALAFAATLTPAQTCGLGRTIDLSL